MKRSLIARAAPLDGTALQNLNLDQDHLCAPAGTRRPGVHWRSIFMSIAAYIAAPTLTPHAFPETSLGDAMPENELTELATRDFEPLELPVIDWSHPTMQQHLWLLNVARRMLGQTKLELAGTLDAWIADGDGASVEETSIGLSEAADFFKIAHDICGAALGRMVVVGASQAIE